MKLGDIIINYRSENGLSQREFARRADLSNSLISLIEKGTNPQTGKAMAQDLETYNRIARAMGVSLQSLFETLGDDATVSMGAFHYGIDDYHEERVQEFWHPVTEEAKQIAKGVDQLPKDQRVQAFNVIKAMFPHLFEVM